jgi:DMSO/TMAO reductase YedYZ heme-binding membrane subunit
MPMLKTRLQSLLLHPLAKSGLALLCGLPMVWLVWAAANNGLGANPAEALIRSTGDWTLRSLCVVLAVTPLRLWTGLPQVARFRRLLGLNVFAYGTAHLLAYAWLDMGLDLADVWADVNKRPFIFVGFSMRPFGTWASFAGGACIDLFTPWRHWPSCTSGGCAPVKTTSPRFGSTPRC